MSNYNYYTPIALLDKLLDFISAKTISSAIDISCGPFNLLNAAANKYPNVKCIGVDIENQVTDPNQGFVFFKQDGRRFAQQQKSEGKTYDLILSNPPFGRLQKSERLFENEEDALLCSRYECEMMYANTMLAHEGSWMIAILPATFVEGELYAKYRKSLSMLYYINALIKLPECTFSKGTISSYAIILYRTNNVKDRNTILGYAQCIDSEWSIIQEDMITANRTRNGIWQNANRVLYPKEKKNISSISRGNISSTMFSSNGTPVLHCSSNFSGMTWIPSQRFCRGEPSSKAKYVEPNDIIINRIGKCAGAWTKYTGKKMLVSDCLIVIHGGEKIEDYLKKYTRDNKLLLPIKGVATKYISAADLLQYYFVVNVSSTES